MRRNYALILIALCLAVAVTYGRGALVLPKVSGLDVFPARLGEWRQAGETVFDAPTLAVLRPTDYLMRLYVDQQGDWIGLYVGYHDGGPESGPIHSPRNCLPGSGWDLLASAEMNITPAGQAPLRVVRALYAKDGVRTLYYYWYQAIGEPLTGDFALKFRQITGMLLARRRDAAFIRLQLSDLPVARADALVGDFLASAWPLLKERLPRADF